MKKILSFLIVAATIYFVACNVEEGTISQTRELPTKNPYAISIPQAIERLNAIFPDVAKTTRTTIANVETLTRADFGLTTRAVNGALPTDPLIYIIPTDNNGCAIVGADRRMEAVYAVLENTTLTTEDILGIETRSDSQNEEDGAEIKEFVSTMLNDAITYNSTRLVGNGDSRPESPSDTITISDSTIMHTIVPPLLKTKWHQGNPYSFCFPTQYNNLTGCGPLAAAQILFFHRQPTYINSSASPFNWGYIEQCERDKPHAYSTNLYSIEASKFIYEIAMVMNASPASNGEVKVSGDAIKKVFRLTDFSFSHRSYSENEIIRMLEDSLPVYIFGGGQNVSAANPGHAWVIDGLRIYTTNNTHILFHCNYGWGGQCDGYYYSGIFDPSVPRSENFIEEWDLIESLGSNYSYHLQILSYEKPN